MQEDGENMGTENQAVLSNRDGFTVFRFGKYTIRFRAPYSLERYTKSRKSALYRPHIPEMKTIRNV